MFDDIFNYEVLQEASEQMFGFSKITMLRDFGPLKAGEKHAHIWFDTESAEVTVYADDNTLTHLFRFKLEPR